MVLLVEDEMLVRLIGSDALSDAGYTVVEAETADEAVKLLEGGGEVHLLFTDIRMPGSMDGLALAELVRQRWPDIRILLTSGDTLPTREQIPDEGSFLQKPYRVDALRAEVQRLICETPSI
ncbi:Response regulator receiver domain-containing protein [Sphingomonas guangdongensis]|uniref:Response regulator receiver domain-containing protein n=1 Tax=Sphingomonas guangdongensis TaxID=1141890 RepID=A0A285R1S8_9SPHN|nr:Response regulator receiver domain-containing protein [Sphingomonas guangdongensis]